MKRKALATSGSLFVAALLVVAVFTIIASAEQPTTTAKEVPAKIEAPSRYKVLDGGAQTFSSDELATEGRQPRALAGDKNVVVVVEMEGEPLSGIYAKVNRFGIGPMTAAAQRNHTAQLEAAQAPVIAAVKAQGGYIFGDMQIAYNGILMMVPQSALPQLAAMPGVRAIHDAPVHYPARDNSISYTGAEDVWNNLGEEGDGVTIAIIDTGIDYYHSDIDGTGVITDYNDDDHEIVEPGSFPTLKVIGGLDFAGPNYDAGGTTLTETVPISDADPLDGDGHGTHVAGIAAGVGLDIDGTDYKGMAPEASLYAYKVFGEPAGSTNLTMLAIERAMDPNDDGDMSDHVDVINMSLGSDYGGPAGDPDIVASNNAAEAGVIVVIAAGNAGDNVYIHGSPGTALKGIGVAGVTDPGNDLFGMAVFTPTKSTHEVMPADWGSDFIKNPVTATVAYVGRGCGGIDPDGAVDPYLTDPVTDMIVLIDRGTCWFSDKAITAEDHGAAGVLIKTYAGRELSGMSPGLPTHTVDIPVVMILHDLGEAMKTLLPTQTITVALSGDYIIANLGDTVYASSSRGPRYIDSALKPDVAAPSVNVMSAQVGTGDDGISYSGTSMGTPHVAGAAALLRGLFPDWNPWEIKAALMNTAVDMADLDGNKYPLSRQGAGRIAVYEAGQLSSVALGDGDPPLAAGIPVTRYTSSLSWGVLPVSGDGVWYKTVEVRNKRTGASAAISRTYDVTWTFQFTTDYDSGVSLVVPEDITVLPDTEVFTVELHIDADALPDYVYGTKALNEFDGFVIISETFQYGDSGWSRDYLRVPFHLIPREYSVDEMGDMSNDISYTGAASATVPVSNTGLITADNYFVTAIFTDANNSLVADYGDIRYVGLESWGSGLSFVINTYGLMRTPIPYWGEFDIYIDVDEDGASDYIVYNDNYGRLTGQGFDNQWLPVIIDLSTGGASVAYLSYVDFNSALMEMLVPASYIGLGAGNTDFDFSVVYYDYNGNYGVTSAGSYNIAGDPFSFSGGDDPGPSNAEDLTVAINPTGYLANPARKGVMALYYNDWIGTDQAEIMMFAAEHLCFMPIILKNAP